MTKSATLLNIQVRHEAAPLVCPICGSCRNEIAAVRIFLHDGDHGAAEEVRWVRNGNLQHLRNMLPPFPVSGFGVRAECRCLEGHYWYQDTTASGTRGVVPT